MHPHDILFRAHATDPDGHTRILHVLAPGAEDAALSLKRLAPAATITTPAPPTAPTRSVPPTRTPYLVPYELATSHAPAPTSSPAPASSATPASSAPRPVPDPFPPCSADTMSQAIALSSPSGRMSKRARCAAEQRLAKELFDDLGPAGLKGQPSPGPSNATRLRQHAVMLQDFPYLMNALDSLTPDKGA